MAAVALEDLARFEFAAGRIAALRAAETVGPAQLENSLPASLLGAVAFEKFDHAQAFLKLNHIPRHFVTSCLFDGYEATLGRYH